VPKLLRRGKSTGQAEADEAAAQEPEAPAAPDRQAAAQPEPDTEPEPDTQPEPSPVAAAGAAQPDGGKRRVATGRPGGLLARMYGDPGEMSRAERERQAALEFEQAVAPVMDLLAASVPEASSPEEAARAWESRVGELRPDPDGGAYVAGDRFDREARVYYRLLRRDYQRNPRPSQAAKSGVTHHLHSRYNLFPGTKGW